MFFSNFKRLCHIHIHVVSSLSQLPSLSHATSPGASSTSNFLASFCHLTKPTQFFILRLMFPDLPQNCTCVKPYIFYPLTASEEALCIAQTKNRKAVTQRNRHNSLLGPEIPQGIRSCHGTLPLTQTYSNHTATSPS